MGSREASAPPGAIRMLDAGTGFSTPFSVTCASATVTPQLGRWSMTDGAASASPGRRLVAQACGHVHAVADVVVALHQDDLAGGDPRADGDGRDGAGDLADDVVQLQDRLEQRAGGDAHQHHAVAEPLGDADATARADVPQQGPKGGQHVDGAFVPLELRECREPGHVDEGETAMNSHAKMLSCRRWPSQSERPSRGRTPRWWPSGWRSYDGRMRSEHPGAPVSGPVD